MNYYFVFIVADKKWLNKEKVLDMNTNEWYSELF